MRKIKTKNMRRFYLVSAIIVSVLILVIAFAQLGATCTWYLFSSNAPVFMVLLQVAALGAITGGLLVLFWKAPAVKEDDGEVEESETPDE